MGTLALAAAAASAEPPIVVGDPARPSAVTITDGSTYVGSTYGIAMDVACVAFVNHGPRTATKVGLNLAYVDAAGTVLGVLQQRHVLAGHQHRQRARLVHHDLRQSRRRQLPLPVPAASRRGPAVPLGRIIATPLLVEFADGTSWQAPNPPKAGDQVTAP